MNVLSEMQQESSMEMRTAPVEREDEQLENKHEEQLKEDLDVEYPLI